MDEYSCCKSYADFFDEWSNLRIFAQISIEPHTFIRQIHLISAGKPTMVYSISLLH